jgi:hypothetical protein
MLSGKPIPILTALNTACLLFNRLDLLYWISGFPVVRLSCDRVGAGGHPVYRLEVLNLKRSTDDGIRIRNDRVRIVKIPASLLADDLVLVYVETYAEPHYSRQ